MLGKVVPIVIGVLLAACMVILTLSFFIETPGMQHLSELAQTLVIVLNALLLLWLAVAYRKGR